MNLKLSDILRYSCTGGRFLNLRRICDTDKPLTSIREQKRHIQQPEKAEALAEAASRSMHSIKM